MTGLNRLTGQFWGGECPVCLTVEAEMFKNVAGHWECRICHTQIEVEEAPKVLSEKGIGRFVRTVGGLCSVFDAIPPQIGRIAEDLRV